MTERPMISKHHKSTRIPITVIAAVASFWLGACTQIPELDEAVPNWVRRADYPELRALDLSVTTKILPQDDSEKITQEMTARQNNLKRKAKRLNTSVVDDAAQTRMSDGITR